MPAGKLTNGLKTKESSGLESAVGEELYAPGRRAAERRRLRAGQDPEAESGVARGRPQGIRRRIPQGRGPETASGSAAHRNNARHAVNGLLGLDDVWGGH